jgi:antirestriction protein ArdC
MPVSMSTGKRYRGINVLILWLAGFSDHRWGTKKAWAEKGCFLKDRDQRFELILHYSRFKVEDKDGEEKLMHSRKVFPVFNAQQMDGVEPLEETKAEPLETDAAVDEFVKNTGAIIREGGRACYDMLTKVITMPLKAAFIATKTSTRLQAYYATLLHELIHWTGDKVEKVRFSTAENRSDEDYAKEELVAEIGSAFLCSILGVSSVPRPDHAHYLNSWIDLLKDDDELIMEVTKLASNAIEHLETLQPQEEQKAA